MEILEKLSEANPFPVERVPLPNEPICFVVTDAKSRPDYAYPNGPRLGTIYQMEVRIGAQFWIDDDEARLSKSNIVDFQRRRTISSIQHVLYGEIEKELFEMAGKLRGVLLDIRHSKDRSYGVISEEGDRKLAEVAAQLLNLVDKLNK